MKIKSLLIVILITFTISCQDKPKEKQLEKENISEADISKDNVLIVDETLVKKEFMKNLRSFSDGRDLATCNVAIGDLNGDNLLDAVVDYGLQPTYEDNGGGGNAISEISGLVAFINNGKELEIVDRSEDFAGIYAGRNELKKISNGDILLEGLELAEGDARGFPTIKTKTIVVLKNNKLTKK